QAPPRAAGRGLRRGAGGRAAPRLPAAPRAAHGAGILARSVPPVLDGPRRGARAPSGPHGAGDQTEAQAAQAQTEAEETMKSRESYAPGPAAGAEVRKDGDTWTLVLVRDLHHPPMRVWQALTDPAHLREWAPFDADRSLASPGPAKLTTVGVPAQQVSESAVTRAEAPTLLEYSWGGNDLRWQLEPRGTGTRLTLWHNIDRRYISWGAAGWHVCFDVLERLLAGEPIGRIVGTDALQFSGWHRLTAEYAQQFGLETTH